MTWRGRLFLQLRWEKNQTLHQKKLAHEMIYMWKCGACILVWIWYEETIFHISLLRMIQNFWLTWLHETALVGEWFLLWLGIFTTFWLWIGKFKFVVLDRRIVSYSFSLNSSSYLDVESPPSGLHMLFWQLSKVCMHMNVRLTS